MNPFSGFLLLLVLCAGITLSGYWLAALHQAASPGERLSIAALTGLSSLLLLVAAVNFFAPLSGPVAWLCLTPALAAIALPSCRRQCFADVRATLRSPKGLGTLGLAVGFLILLLWPALADRQILFYDGSANHDSFFWIISGEYQQQHSYMDVPSLSATQPRMNVAVANTGWQPGWGRMGAEGLLAFVASLMGATPLSGYLYSSASLYLPWLAAVFLAAHTFYRRGLSWIALLALAALQPMFIFYHANTNLPNLVGVITGAGVVIAAALALRAEAPSLRTSWCLQVLLHVHGLYVSYPEMVPFVLLPCALLWMRHWFVHRPSYAWQGAGWVCAAFVAGSAINPATTIRAWRGLVLSFASARADQSWTNLFEPLSPAGYLPALTSLSVPATIRLGTPLAIILSLTLLASGWIIWRRAHDRFGLFASLTGSLALLVYTWFTGFSYGWQKTAQFGGVFITATGVIALLDALMAGIRGSSSWLRWTTGLSLIACVLFFSSAVTANLGEITLWSRQKTLSIEWLNLREASGSTLQGKPVLIDASSFRMPFFYGMWSSYFLPRSHIYYANRGGPQGGYLRQHVLTEDALPPGGPAAVLVGKPWASAFDANSVRLLDGREHVLLETSNRVTDMQGVYPLNGVPEHASTKITFVIVPHSSSRLRLKLAPRIPQNWPEAAWRVVARVDGRPAMETEVAGAPPWQFDVPLTAAQNNVIELIASNPGDSDEALPFSFAALRIDGSP